jgi:hypothetical protein
LAEPLLLRLRRWLEEPVDAASLVALRVGFGLLMAGGAARFVLSGWVDTLFVQPRFHFHYPGFHWLEPWSSAGLVYAHYAVIFASALGMAFGAFYRVSGALFVLSFASAQLWDLTNYLNHYYLAVLLGGLLTVLPAHRCFSVDAWRKPALRSSTVPRAAIALLRFQVGCVYFYAGLAKLGADWLLHGQPLGIWLSQRDELPFLGALAHIPAAPVVMSWAGFLYDLTIPLWLSLPKIRLAAYVVLLVFHGVTWALFEIGLFPFIMSLSALIFFSPGWPRGLLHRLRLRASARCPEESPRSSAAAPARRLPTFTYALAALYCATQLLVPLRHFAVGGQVLWDEVGMRWSWKVMVRSKKGSVTYRVREKGGSRDREVNPLEYLEMRQLNEMASQPDMILQLARHIARDRERFGETPLEVRADVFVSLNGRRAQRLIDPHVDLATARDAVWQVPSWVLPPPTTPPLAAR